MKRPAQYDRNRKGIPFRILCFGTIIVALAFTNKTDPGALVFQETASMRSSFCLYNDGKFYKTSSAGCIGQSFAWGYWKNVQDTILLDFSAQDIFIYDVVKSRDTQSSFQIVRVVDCYNQPVRFQFINHDGGYSNLYNTGILRIIKGSSINYPAPVFDDKDYDNDYVTCNADTLTYQWHCNRECLESISGGQQYTDREVYTKRVVLQNKRVIHCE